MVNKKSATIVVIGEPSAYQKVLDRLAKEGKVELIDNSYFGGKVEAINLEMEMMRQAPLTVKNLIETAFTPEEAKNKPYFRKDKTKFEVCNKLISRGSKNSSSERYRIAAGPSANVGVYDEYDVVGVSAEGARKGRINPDFEEIKKAVDAGATIITDSRNDRMRGYNIGERQVAGFLFSTGYIEAAAPGRWRKP